MTNNASQASPEQAKVEQDDCQVCHGANGGVKGNENVVAGVVMCDYCHAAVHPVIQAWRCFHCDELFTDRKLAEDHFGLVTLHPAACVDPLRSDERAMRERAVSYERSWREALDQRDEARAAIAALSTDDERLAKAVRSFRNADTEFRRAKNSGEQPRLWNAGNRYQTAKWRMFAALAPKEGDGRATARPCPGDSASTPAS